jgi:Zn-dependent peptidase ImmA (M78 family)
MESLNTFLEHRVTRLIDLYQLNKPEVLPIDLCEVARNSGVLSIEDREMIPEAALSLEQAGFRIYLQSNFIDASRTSLRRRFSIAHEIAHTLFYEPRDGVVKPVRNAPRGTKLESACHHGARLLLVPQRFLDRELRRTGRRIRAEGIVELAHRFEVSVEVMLRRLSESGVFESTQVAFVLVYGPKSREATIEFAVYPPWLKALLPPPNRKGAFASWLRYRSSNSRQATLRDQDGSDRDIHLLFENGMERQTALGKFHVSPFSVTPSQYIFELRIEEFRTPQFDSPLSWTPLEPAARRAAEVPGGQVRKTCEPVPAREIAECAILRGTRVDHDPQWELL